MNLSNSTQSILQHRRFTTVKKQLKNTTTLRHLFFLNYTTEFTTSYYRDKLKLTLHFDTLTEVAEISPERDLWLSVNVPTKISLSVSARIPMYINSRTTIFVKVTIRRKRSA